MGQRKVLCVRYKKKLDGLKTNPIMGELGQKVFDNVSAQAWSDWLEHQTLLINEYRLSLIEAKSRAFLKDELDKFFFGDGSEKPSDFK